MGQAIHMLKFHNVALTDKYLVLDRVNVVILGNLSRANATKRPVMGSLYCTLPYTKGIMEIYQFAFKLQHLKKRQYK